MNINVVLAKGTDYNAFEVALTQQGLTYKKVSSRIFNIESTQAAFPLTDYPDVESISDDVVLDLKPQYAVATQYTGDAANLVADANWGRCRTVRRYNPFTTKDGFLPTMSDVSFSCLRTGVGTDFYVIDNEIDTAHPEFSGRASSIDPNLTDEQAGTASLFHGTGVASAGAGETVGLATSANIFFVKSPDGAGFNTSNLIAAYDVVLQHYLSRAATNRPAVMNHSFGGVGSIDPVLTAMLDDLISAGIVIVVAVGNTAYDLDRLDIIPAEVHPDIVRVGASNAFDSLMWFTGTRTGYGSPVSIYAPGTALVVANSVNATASSGSNYVSVNGTSFAGPTVAGVLLCMLEGYQRLNSKEEVQALTTKLIQNSTKGVLRFTEAHFIWATAGAPGVSGVGTIHNRIPYLDPFVEFEEIKGLTPL